MSKNTSMSLPSTNAGYLELIVGPMFSGKTSRLVEVYKQCQFCNIDVAVINHNIDNRYDEELLSTHDKVKIPCIKTEKLRDVWANEKVFNNIEGEIFRNESLFLRLNDKIQISKSSVILINEGQFFDDLYEVVIEMLQCGKKVYVCGLDGDFKRQRFGRMLDLIPYCDRVEKLNAFCSLCRDGTLAIFSHRVSGEATQIVIGADNYMPLCRGCYKKSA